MSCRFKKDFDVTTHIYTIRGVGRVVEEVSNGKKRATNTMQKLKNKPSNTIQPTQH
jgi:hypothetical protein